MAGRYFCLTYSQAVRSALPFGNPGPSVPWLTHLPNFVLVRINIVYSYQLLPPPAQGSPPHLGFPGALFYSHKVACYFVL